ncbi:MULTISPECIES: hypothetical protein [unclassified Clostridium]|uniref:hypothetical protein n=1 Tax=unclassified Clostridium TaxID=2614128 RepID=UPI00029824E1|nr:MULTISPECIES: hypothetical protein [unclassified Clostridium]EKQ56815.1 MAG: hypothetical protein A370_01590 [Clostridium sp. Maddingley MBC34-26]
MIKEFEGKTVRVVYVDAVDESRAIQVGDIGEIDRYENGLTCILFKTGFARGSIYCLDEAQLKEMEC